MMFPFTDWQHEVANGDTKLGFAEWQQHREEAEAPTTDTSLQPKTPSALRMVCPSCGSEDISENNVVHVRLKIEGWDAEGEPMNFIYPWDEVNDTIRTVEPNEAPRWYCNACCEETNELKLHPDLLELICLNCRETNYALPAEKGSKPCDDCKEIGTLLTFEEDVKAHETAAKNVTDGGESIP